MIPDRDRALSAVNDARARSAAAPWGEPVSLDSVADPPSFPVEVLPTWLRDMVIACVDVLGVPSDLPAGLALPLVGATLAHRCVASPWPGWHEHPVLYSVVVASPGESKSPTLSALLAPVVAAEHDAARAMAPAIDAATARHALLLRRVASLRDRAAKATTLAQRTSAESDLAAAECDLAACIVPVAPRYSIGGDCTPEALGQLLAAHSERVLVADAEGGAFDSLTGLRYAKSAGTVDLDLVLQAWAGERHTVARVTAGRNCTLNAPLLSFSLAVQPDVLHGAAKRPEIINRGVLPRMLVAWPRSRVGQRDMGEHPWPGTPRERYGACMRRLWELPLAVDEHGRPERRLVRFAIDARDRFTRWRDELEAQRGEGRPLGDPPGLAAFAAKLEGHCVRFACVLHVADRVDHDADDVLSGTIDGATVERAIRIAEYYLAHSQRMYTVLTEAPAVADARVLLVTLRRKGAETTTRSDAARRWHGGDTKRADAALAVLVERGWARPVGEAYALHPSVASSAASVPILPTVPTSGIGRVGTIGTLDDVDAEAAAERAAIRAADSIPPEPASEWATYLGVTP